MDGVAYIDEFVTAATERLQKFEEDFFASADFSKDLLDQFLVYLHTIKGAAALIQLNYFKAYIHELETHFQGLYESESAIPKELRDSAKICLDQLAYFVDEVGKGRGEAGLESHFASAVQTLKGQALRCLSSSELSPLLESLDRLRQSFADVMVLDLHDRNLLSCFVESYSARRICEELELLRYGEWIRLIIGIIEACSMSKKPLTNELAAWSKELCGELIEGLKEARDQEPISIVEHPLSARAFGELLDSLGGLNEVHSLQIDSDFLAERMRQRAVEVSPGWISSETAESTKTSAQDGVLPGQVKGDGDVAAPQTPLSASPSPNSSPSPVSNLDFSWSAMMDSDDGIFSTSPRKITPVGASTVPPALVPAKVKSIDVRVKVEKLTEFGDLTGELVTVTNLIKALTADDDQDSDLARAHEYLSRVTASMQELSLGLRLVPIKSLFSRMHRVVSETAEKLNKKCELKIKGEDVEIDRQISENLFDPLIHLVRNSVDHGIESPERRRELGKSEVGLISIECIAEGGEVKVVIRDDGAGIDKKKIIDLALKKNLITKNHFFRTEADIFNLIFVQGFTTTAQLSEISGRGVGMDIVRRNVEALSGRIQVRSKLGSGTAFVMALPTTLSIIEVMRFKVKSFNFCIPIEMIRETMSIKNARVSVFREDQKYLEFRGNQVPIYNFAEIFNGCDQDGGAPTTLLICGFSDSTVAFEVNSISGRADAVVKPLPPYFGGTKGFLGCTILGLGDVALILDVNELARMGLKPNAIHQPATA